MSRWPVRGRVARPAGRAGRCRRRPRPWGCPRSSRAARRTPGPREPGDRNPPRATGRRRRRPSQKRRDVVVVHIAEPSDPTRATAPASDCMTRAGLPAGAACEHELEPGIVAGEPVESGDEVCDALPRLQGPEVEHVRAPESEALEHSLVGAGLASSATKRLWSRPWGTTTTGHGGKHVPEPSRCHLAHADDDLCVSHRVAHRGTEPEHLARLVPLGVIEEREVVDRHDTGDLGPPGHRVVRAVVHLHRRRVEARTTEARRACSYKRRVTAG